MAWWVYILRCGDGRLYTGLTTNVARRIAEHQAGTGGRFTRRLRPVELVYSEACRSERNARRREWQLKTWSRAQKLALIDTQHVPSKRVHPHWRMV